MTSKALLSAAIKLQPNWPCFVELRLEYRGKKFRIASHYHGIKFWIASNVCGGKLHFSSHFKQTADCQHLNAGVIKNVVRLKNVVQLEIMWLNVDLLDTLKWKNLKHARIMYCKWLSSPPFRLVIKASTLNFFILLASLPFYHVCVRITLKIEECLN